MPHSRIEPVPTVSWLGEVTVAPWRGQGEKGKCQRPFWVENIFVEVIWSICIFWHSQPGLQTILSTLVSRYKVTLSIYIFRLLIAVYTYNYGGNISHGGLQRGTLAGTHSLRKEIKLLQEGPQQTLVDNRRFWSKWKVNQWKVRKLKMYRRAVCRNFWITDIIDGCEMYHNQ